MTTPRAERPNTAAILSTLKDFQRATVEYVYERLYVDQPPALRFLVADEVGLGKTLVARGLVAKIIDRLWDEVGRIDVIYVCANADIARQNIARLNVQADAKIALASRLTLLPVTLPDISCNKLNFIALTPGTSFDPRSSEGMWMERAVLYALLHDAWGLGDRKGPYRALQGWVGDYHRWRPMVEGYMRDRAIDASIRAAYVAALAAEDEGRRSRGQPTLRETFEEVAARLKQIDYIPKDVAGTRAELVGQLREILARTCLSSLEPDLVVLDEFQRFRHLLRGNDPTAELARALFDYRADTGHRARVLLLSATPYKMYTQSIDSNDDHYRDFMETVAFLQDDGDRTASFRDSLERYRTAFFRLQADTVGELRQAKDDVEAELRRVMVRNERLQVANSFSPMLCEMPRTGLRLQSSDLAHFVALDRLSTYIAAGDSVEYWKSAPYLANFMENYVLKRKLRDRVVDPATRAWFAGLLEERSGAFLRWSDIEAYREVDPANARLRYLLEAEVDRGWSLLWLPPSLPYYRPGPPFDGARAQSLTKALLFSSWKVVPKVVATMASLEAERRMVGSPDGELAYGRLPQQRRPLLRFAEQDRRTVGAGDVDEEGPDGRQRRLTGMPVLALLYPCATLASRIDPLAVAARLRQSGLEPTIERVIGAVADEIRPMVDSLVEPHHRTAGGAADEAWYWSALAQLDAAYSPTATAAWLGATDEANAWSGMVRSGPDEDRSLFDLHVKAFAEHAVTALGGLGRPPDDLVELLATIAVASPAVCTLRSLMRLWPDDDVSELVAARAGAARAAMAFRGMYNLPETISLIRGLYLAEADDRTPYWRLVLQYGLHGNLQSVLDEFAHVLRDALGLFDGTPSANCAEVATAIADAASIRTVRLEFDELARVEGDGEIALRPRSLRCRYAMRFGSDKSDDGSDVTREDQVRGSFNSPFRPFVVGTTSIGQEGLDFHWYCHRIYHWNLPSNPVDLEQREGRIDRYKGHAIRRNVAKQHGDELLAESAVGRGVVRDPWRRMFEMARWRPDRPRGANELDPWWVYPLDEGAAIERHVPALPLSRDEAVLAQLKDSLVAYRLVFGQPRQEDLLDFLRRRLSDENLSRVLEECRMDLSAPPWAPGAYRERGNGA